MSTAARVDILLALKSTLQGTEQALGFLTKLAGGLSAAAIAWKAFDLAKSSGELASEIKNLAAQANLTTDAFQALKNGSAEFGVKQEQIVQGAVTLRKNLEDAAKNGASPLNEHLSRLKLTAAGLQSLSLEKQFEVIGQRIATAADKEAAFAAGMELIGAKNAPKLMEFLQKLGVEGFDKMAASTRKLSLSEAELESLDKAANYWERIATATKVAAAKATNSVLGNPLLRMLTNTQGDDKLANAKANLEYFKQQGNEVMVAQLQGVVSSLEPRPLSPQAEQALINADAHSRAMQKATAEKMSTASLDADLANMDEADRKLRQKVDAFNTFDFSKLAKKVREGLEKDDKMLLGQEFATGVDRSNEALRSFDTQLNKIGDNPFLTDVEKHRQRAAVLVAENAEIDRQIELLKKFAQDNPGVDPAAVRGQIRGLGERATANGRELGRTDLATSGFGANLDANLVGMQDKIRTPAQGMADTITATIGGAFDSLGTNIKGLINGTEDWHDALRNIGQTITGTLINGIVKMFTEWIEQRALAAIADMGWSTAQGTTAAAAAAPGAALTSISSFGVAAVVGIAALVAAMAAFGGFAQGGFTDDGPTNAVRGIVHAKEWVAPKWMVEDKHYGPMIASLEAGRQGVPGFAGGGFVGTFKNSFLDFGNPLGMLKAQWHQSWHPMDAFRAPDGPVKNYSSAELNAMMDTQEGRNQLAAVAASGGFSGDSSSSMVGGGGGGVGSGSGLGDKPTQVVLVDYRDQNAYERAVSDPRFRTTVKQIGREDRGV